MKSEERKRMKKSNVLSFLRRLFPFISFLATTLVYNEYSVQVK